MGVPLRKERSFFEEYVGTCFVAACVKLTETYFSVPAVKAEHYLAADLVTPFEVAAFIQFTADSVDVKLTLALEKNFAIAFYNKMVGENETQLTDDVLDCLGELTNTIYGMAKAPLVDKGHSFSSARPEIIRDLTTHFKGRKSLEIRFRVDNENPNFSLILSV